MNSSNRCWRTYGLSLTVWLASLVGFAGCVPLETARPTLDEVRLGNVRGATAEDTSLRPGETQGEVTEVNRSRQEIYVLSDNGQRHAVPYDFDRTKVTYHGRDYTIENIEAGDRIAYLPAPRGRSYVDIIRVQEPVQARSGARSARTNPPRPRTDVVEGTVERIDLSRGVFDVLPRTGRAVTVSLPYNARQADIDSFRTLRRGDPVRLEGEFVNPDNFQLMAFLSPREP